MKLRDRIKELRRVKASDILPNPANWRTHPKAQQDAMRGILAEVGIADALLVRETPDGLQLIDGHLRADVAPDSEWPVLVLDVDDRAAAKLLPPVDPLAAMAETDPEHLEALLQQVDTDSDALQQLLVQLAAEAGIEDDDAEIIEDEVPEPPAEATTKPGDLWILGDQHLISGNTSKPEEDEHQKNDATIHLVNTDPPYNVKVEPRSNNAIAAGLSSFSGPKHHQSLDLARHPEKSKPTGKQLRAKDRPLTNDFVSEAAFDQLLHAWFGNIARVLEPGRAFYIWGGYANCANYPPVLKACELYFSQAVIWVKEHPVLTRKDFMGNHEWCFYGWREGAAHVFVGPTNAVDVWTIKKINPQSMVHLTEKPVELAGRAMRYSSRPGENVLDLFGGSGSTLIAAEQTGRQAYLMELDPLYCDVIVQRWEKFTGQKAERAGEAT